MLALVTFLSLVGGVLWLANFRLDIWKGALNQLNLHCSENGAESTRGGPFSSCGSAFSSKEDLVQREETQLTASGTIEATQVRVAPEVSGTLNRVLVHEGDAVGQGDVLAEIDTRLIDASIAEAEANLALAQAQLARVESGARSEEIALLKALVALAEVQEQGAHDAWQDAILLRDNPQELDLQVAAVQTEVAALEQRTVQAIALKNGAELMDALGSRQVDWVRSGIDITIDVPGLGSQTFHQDLAEGEKRQAWANWNLASTDLWSAWVKLNQAQAAQIAAERNKQSLLDQRANPQQLQIQVAQARAAYGRAVAATEAARADLVLAQAGAREEQVTVARTAVAQAQAAVESLQTQRTKYILRSSMDGLVLMCAVHEGELAQPGRSLLTLGNLDVVEVVLYVAEEEMGQVALGQLVEVTADSFPDQAFTGQVIWISDQAEFTPKNVQTREDRVNTVYPVKVSILNPSLRLRPGMPVDAVFAVG
jgi:multidrug efflux pump subunit AcrA (membrane-fusion protein)